jgi:hypothetical protein
VARISDENDLRPGFLGVREEAGKRACPDHAGLVHDEDGSGVEL